MATMGTEGLSNTPVIDPVCGMQVDPATAAASSEYQGVTYYFCAVGCKRRFDMDPESYIDAPSHGAHDAPGAPNA